MDKERIQKWCEENCWEDSVLHENKWGTTTFKVVAVHELLSFLDNN
jgi:hypothetical protein